MFSVEFSFVFLPLNRSTESKVSSIFCTAGLIYVDIITRDSSDTDEGETKCDFNLI
jgi:hypothetical protein